LARAWSYREGSREEKIWRTVCGGFLRKEKAVPEKTTGGKGEMIKGTAREQKVQKLSPHNSGKYKRKR